MVVVRSVVISVLLVGSAAQAAADSPLSGQWTGSYNCGATASMTLDISEGTTPDFVEGTFTFGAARGSGSYRVVGRLTPDGTFTLVPQEWIERPPGFDAVGLEGRLDPNGTLILGRMQGCGPGDFRATREVDEETRRAVAEAPPAPLSGGVYAGTWQGAISCSANRRGRTELYPLQLVTWQDGAGVSGLAEVQIYRQRGSGEGAVFTQLIALGGSETDNGLMLGRPLTLDHGGAPIDLRGIEAALTGEGRIEGSVRMKTCATVAATHTSAPLGPAIPTDLSGTWAGTGGQRGETAVNLRSAGEDASPFLELIASAPVSRPEAERVRLVITLVAIATLEGTSAVLLPVSYRAASGEGEGEPQARLTGVADALAFIAKPQPDGNLELSAIRQRQGYDAALAGRQRDPALNFVLARPSAALAEGISRGETPPADLGPGIAGLVGTAPTREGQCRVLETWLAPHAEGLDLGRVSIDGALTRITPAFEDADFVPVFGVPFQLTVQSDRSALAGLMRDTCDRGMGVRLVGLVGDRVMRSEQGFMAFNAKVANRREFLGWRDAVRAELADLPYARESLDRITVMEREVSSRSRDAALDEARELRAALDHRRAMIRGEILLIQARELPESGFESGALDRVFALMRRATTEVTNREQARQVAEIAGVKARLILEEPMGRLLENAVSTPQTLAGLEQLMGERRRMQRPLAGMREHFGQAGPDHRLGAVERRLDELWQDSAIRADFAATLAGISTGRRGGEVLRNAAARYIDLDALGRAPGYSNILDAAILRAEVAAVRLVDRSVGPAPGEPTIQEIASFLLERTRAVNDGLAAREAACLAGQFNNPLEALACLQVPATVTGQRGFSVALLSVTKYGCLTEIENTRYVCTYSQELDFDIPGGEAFGGDTLSDWAGQLTSMEAIDARFIRAPDGGWTVITGDIR